MGRTRTDALFILPATWHVYSSAELVTAATQARLPTIGVERYHHAGGALLTYGADIAALTRRARRLRRPDPQGRQARRPRQSSSPPSSNW